MKSLMEEYGKVILYVASALATFAMFAGIFSMLTTAAKIFLQSSMGG